MKLKISFKAIILLLLVINCNNNSNNENKKIRLIYWCANNQYEIDLAQKIVAQWNDLHPDVLVEYQPVPEGQSSEEVILAAVVGQTTPDIYSNMWAGDVEFYVRANKLLQLDLFADFDSVAQDRFSTGVIDQMRAGNGHIYQLLWKTNPIMMIYNRTLFEQAGFLTPPATYSGFFQAAKKISKDRNGDGYNDQWVGVTDIRARWRDRLFDFYPFYIAASGGRTLMTKNELDIDTTAARRVFAYFQQLFRHDCFPYIVPASSHDLFLHSDVATRFTGPWEITHAEKLKPEGFRYDFTGLPQPDDLSGPAYTYGDPKSIVIFAETRFPNQAWEFALFLISKQSDYDLLSLTSQLPYRQNILKDSLFIPYFEQNPLMVKFARQSEFTRIPDTTPELKEIFDAISQEFEACVFYQAKTPGKAVEEMVKRIQLILK